MSHGHDDAGAALERKAGLLETAERIARLGSWEWEIGPDRVTWSRELYRIFGRDPDIAPPSWEEHDELYGPQDLDRLRELVVKAVEEAVPFEIELTVKRPDGKVLLCIARGEPRVGEDGRVTHLDGFLQDVTDEKLIESDLLRTKRQLEEAQEIASIGSWEVDLGAEHLVWSDQVYRIFGLHPGAFEETEEAFFARVHPDDREELEQARERFLAGVEDLDATHRIVRPDGEVRWVRERARLVTDERGAAQRMIGTVQDITESRLAAEEREQLHRQLATAGRLEAIGRLAGGVAHDFNNLLTIILGHAEALRSQYAGSASLAEGLEHIRVAAKRSAELTRQLLTFAKGDESEVELVCCQEVVQSMLPMLRRLLPEDLALDWRPGLDDDTVEMSPVHLRQVLSNLCLNAADAIDHGGTITISTRVDRGESRPDMVVLSVADDGRGMSPETADRIFEPFYTTKPVGEGAGLGLSMIYGLVRQSGGRIEVLSERGRGSRFDVFLPRSSNSGAAAGQQGSARSTQASPVGRGQTILVVEDEPAIIEICRKILEPQGYRIQGFAAARRALDWVGDFAGTVDLLITDVVMPDMTGRELATRLSGQFSGLRVLYMSGYTADVVLRRGVDQERMEFLAKPFSAAELSERVAGLLAER